MAPEKRRLLSFCYRHRTRTALAIFLVVTSFGLSCPSVTMAATTEDEVGHLRMRIIDLEDKITNLYNFTVCRMSELEKRLNEMQIEINNCRETVCPNEDINQYQSEDNSTISTTTCSLGITGTKSDKNISECDSMQNPCENGGSCIDEIGGTICVCSLPFAGDKCEKKLDPCKMNKCENEAVCVASIDHLNYTCSCSSGFNGTNCEFNVDDCAINEPCLNGGTCTDGIHNYTCACADGFFGTHCEDAPEYHDYLVLEGYNLPYKSKQDIFTSTSTGSDTFTTETVPESTTSDTTTAETDLKSTSSRTSTTETGTIITTSGTSTTEAEPKSSPSVATTTETDLKTTGSGTSATETEPESTTSDISTTTETEPDASTTRKFEHFNASLIISVGGGIQQVSLDEFQITQVIQNESQAVVFDVNIRTKTLFWFCYKDRKIYKGPIHLRNVKEASTEAEVIMHDPESLVLAISVDWIYNNIYWTDSRGGKIFVSNYDGTMKKFLINDGLSFPAFIVVNPLNGWMHWTDVNKNQIERAGMDGSRREVIVSSNIKSPLGLTLDLVKNRLYWTNYINPSSISSSNFDGAEIKLIFKPNGPEFSHSHFQSITTMEDFVFWTDTTYKKVYKVNKVNGEGLSTVYEYDTDVYDVKVNHVSKQPEGENQCEKRSKKCSHFCFPVPGKKRRNGGGEALVSASCACPDNLILSGDRRHCFYDLLGWHRSVFSQ